jgi:hypothetical protein
MIGFSGAVTRHVSFEAAPFLTESRRELGKRLDLWSHAETQGKKETLRLCVRMKTPVIFCFLLRLRE